MDERSFEIHDDEIDLQEIIERISENIQRRKEAGAYPADPDANLSVKSHPDQAPSRNSSDISRDLALLASQWDIRNTSYRISSHRPFAGRYLIRGRELVHGEVCRYVDPSFLKQASYNRSTARVLEDALYRVSDLETHIPILDAGISRIDLSLDTFNDQISEINSRITRIEDSSRRQIIEEIQQFRQETTAALESFKNEIKDEHERMALQFRNETAAALESMKTEMKDEHEQVALQIRKEVETAIESMKADLTRRIREEAYSLILEQEAEFEHISWFTQILDRRLQNGSSQNAPDRGSTIGDGCINYFLFSDDIQNTPPVSFPIFNDAAILFKNCKNVLDIGCGRGSLLRNLQGNNIGCYGIDLDEDTIQYCKRFDLTAHQVDAFEHLQSLDDKSLDGVFIGQVLEHMPIDMICRLIKLAYDKIQYGSFIIIVVPNITSVQVSSNLFYLDPTHITHLHPEILKFLLKSSGFREIRDKLYQPFPDEFRLQNIRVADHDAHGFSEEIMHTLNSNTDKLNDLLFGYRDYCIWAKK